MARLSLSLLGPFHATLDRQPVTGFESSKARALLAYLAVEAGRPHSRDALAGLLWPDQPDQTARDNLRQTLANLRQAIHDHKAQPPFLHVSRTQIQFNTDSDYWLDVTEFTRLLAACEHHPHRRPDACKSCAERHGQAAGLYRGNFLEQLYLSNCAAFEEWALVRREWLHHLALEALYRLAGYHERRRAYEQAHRYALRQLELDPWREEAHRQAMRALALSGQRSAALVQYETCRRILEDALGVKPARETTALYERIRDEDLNAIDPAHGSCSSLPLSSTPFVGRKKELAEIVELLENPACRLVTLVGLGGIGKTRLALQVAAEQIGAFADGVYFIPLALLGSAEFIVPAIASALKLTFFAQEDPKTQLINHLREKDALLVLDNFEHLLDGAELLAEILRQAPSVTLLVTSRERLNLQGEWVLDIQGLQFPASDQIEGVEGYSAVELFVQQARRVYPVFSLSEGDKPYVVRICRLVEGMPLAIELAAAWMRLLSCREIAQEIEQGLGFLAAAVRDMPERQQNMRTVFVHSWKFLSDEEQRVFRRLSVFRGGFDREAAEKVAGASLPLLAALVDKSLLRRNDRERYDLHELLRQFAYEKLLESGEAEQTRDRHLDFFVELAEAAEAKFDGAEQVSWLNRLETEHDNLRAAIQWSLDSHAVNAGLRLAGALDYFWYVRGYHGEGREHLAAILSRPETAQRTAARAKALNAAVELWQWGRHHYPEALPLLEEALSIGREVGDPLNIARSMRLLGVAAFDRGDYAAARSRTEEALAILRALGYKPGIARALYFLGDVALFQSDYKRAYGLYEESLQLLRESGEKNQMAYVLRRMGLALLHLGDYARALALCNESLTLNQEVGSQGGVVACLVALAALHSARGRTVVAAQLLGAVEAQLISKHVQVLEIDLDPYHRTLSVVRTQLDEATFAAVWAAGRRMSLEEAIVYGLADDGDAGTTTN